MGETLKLSLVKGTSVPSVHGLCLFLAYINDLAEIPTSVARLFADDNAVVQDDKLTTHRVK